MDETLYGNAASVVRQRFEDLFRSNNPRRDNFLSRLFGMFSRHRGLRISDERAPYHDLGRPTLWDPPAFATIDLTLQSRSDGRC